MFESLKFGETRTPEEIKADMEKGLKELLEEYEIIKAKNPEKYIEDTYSDYTNYIEDLDPLEQ